MAVAWPETKTKFKLRRTKRKTKQNKTEKQNSLNYYLSECDMMIEKLSLH